MKIEDRCYRKDIEYLGDYTSPKTNDDFMQTSNVVPDDYLFNFNTRSLMPDYSKDEHWNPTASSITNKQRNTTINTYDRLYKIQ